MPSEPLMLKALARRVDELERAHRRLKRCCLAVVVVASGLLLMGQAVDRLTAGTVIARNVETQSLLVRDASGKNRILLDADTVGPVSLTLSDKDGRERAAIGVGPAGGVAVVFRDREGVIRAALGVNPQGRPFHLPKREPGGEEARPRRE